MRYSKADREAAANLCSMSACLGAFNPDTMHVYSDLRPSLGIESCESPPAKLAGLAWIHVHRARGFVWDHETDAEAEALIRTGWEPG